MRSTVNLRPSEAARQAWSTAATWGSRRRSPSLQYWAIASAPQWAGSQIFGPNSLKLSVALSQVGVKLSIPSRQKKLFFPSGAWDLVKGDSVQSRVDDIVQMLVEERERFAASATYERLLLDDKPPHSSQTLKAQVPLTATSNEYRNKRQVLDEYFKHLLRILNRIESEGFSASVDDPIIFAVSRDCRLHETRDGRHRMAMARALQIPDVVGEIGWIHRALLQANRGRPIDTVTVVRQACG